MSERMNKERAIEQIKKLIEFTKKAREVIGTPQGENQFYLSDELLQALDIAIESLERNIQTIRVEREFDISELDKGTDYLLTKMTEDFVREFVKANVLEMIASETRDIHKTKAIFEVKVVEPYERKESE